MADLVSFLPLVLIAVLFWALIIRPQSKRAKAMRDMQSSLQPGQRVMLHAGIFGILREVGDDRVRVEVADGVVLEVVRQGVAQVDPAAEPGPAHDVVEEA